MAPVYSIGVYIVASVLLCSGATVWATTTTTPTTTTPTTTTPTTTLGHNLNGKMVTLSTDSGITFYAVSHDSASYTTTPNTTTTPKTTTPKTTTTPETTTTPKSTTPKTTTTTTPRPTPATRGVTVCLRFMTDSGSGELFTLAPLSHFPLTLSYSSPYDYIYSYGYRKVRLRSSIFTATSVQYNPWTRVCVVLDSLKNVVQLFMGDYMSIRKIPSSRMAWSGEPVVDISGFDGQVTDLEVWDYPLQYNDVVHYMNYGSRGTVVTWSNIAYRPRGSGILFEDTYSFEQISSSERPEQRLKYRKKGGRKRLFL